MVLLRANIFIIWDPALKIPMAKNRINNITIEAETLKTLSTAEINFNHELA